MGPMGTHGAHGEPMGPMDAHGPHGGIHGANVPPLGKTFSGKVLKNPECGLGHKNIKSSRRYSEHNPLGGAFWRRYFDGFADRDFLEYSRILEH